MTTAPDGIEAVLYDFGGVFTPSPFDATEDWGRELGVSGNQLLQIVFGPYDEDTDHPWHRLERGEISLLDARDEIIRLGKEAGIDADPLKLFARMGGGEGARTRLVERALEIRRCGYATALVTNNVVEFRERWIDMIPTDELFDIIVDSSEVGLRKPDRRIFDLALERLGGIEPEQTVFLDDFDNNVEAARRIGIHGFLVTTDLSKTLAVLDQLIERRRGS